MGKMKKKPEKDALTRLKAKAESDTEEVVATVLRGETTDLSVRTTAKVRAKLNAYEKIYANYEMFIEKQAKELADGKLVDNPYKELGVARLIAHWLIDTETFLLENEALMKDMSGGVRKRFVEESLDVFPEDIRNELLVKLSEKKQELLIWFAGELQQARTKAAKQKK